MNKAFCFFLIFASFCSATSFATPFFSNDMYLHDNGRDMTNGYRWGSGGNGTWGASADSVYPSDYDAPLYQPDSNGYRLAYYSEVEYLLNYTLGISRGVSEYDALFRFTEVFGYFSETGYMDVNLNVIDDDTNQVIAFGFSLDESTETVISFGAGLECSGDARTDSYNDQLYCNHTDYLNHLFVKVSGPSSYFLIVFGLVSMSSIRGNRRFRV